MLEKSRYDYEYLYDKCNNRNVKYESDIQCVYEASVSFRDWNRVVIYLTNILIFNFMRGLLLKSFEVPGMGDTAVFLMYQAMGVTFV